MSVRLLAQVRAEERAGVVQFAAATIARTQAMVARGKLGAEEATLLGQRLRAFADGVATGLHLGEADTPETRAAVREALAVLRQGGTPE